MRTESLIRSVAPGVIASTASFLVCFAVGRARAPGRSRPWGPRRPAQRRTIPARPPWAGRLPWLTVGYAEVRLLDGDVFAVEGTLDEVESRLSDAARSGQSRRLVRG